MTAKAADAATAPVTVAAKEVATVPAGYKAMEKNGVTLYCRKETPLGTRFPTQVCMTMTQYKESIDRQNSTRTELTGRQKSYSTSQ